MHILARLEVQKILRGLEIEMMWGPLMCNFTCSSPVKKPSLQKAHQFEGDAFDPGSECSEGLGLCVSSLSALIGTVAETSEEKYRLLDQRDRIMRQGKVLVGRGSRGLAIVVKCRWGRHQGGSELFPQGLLFLSWGSNATSGYYCQQVFLRWVLCLYLCEQIHLPVCVRRQGRCAEEMLMQIVCQGREGCSTPLEC